MVASPYEKGEISRARGLLAAVLSAAFFALVGLTTKLSYGSGLSVSSTLTWRFTIAALGMILLAPIFAKGRPRYSKAERLRTMAFGAGGYGLSALLFFISMKHTTTGFANLLLFQNPLVVFLCTAIHQKRMPAAHHVLMLLTTLVGVVMIAIPTGVSGDRVGLIAGLASALTYGIYLFLAERRSTSLDSYWLTTDILSGSAVAFLLYSFFSGTLEIPDAPLVWGALILQGLLCTVIPVILLLFSIKAIGSRNATIASALEPALALGIGSLVLGESFLFIQIVGTALVISSVVGITIFGTNDSQYRSTSRANTRSDPEGASCQF